jgi:hypothetical protein
MSARDPEIPGGSERPAEDERPADDTDPPTRPVRRRPVRRPPNALGPFVPELESWPT